MNEREDLKAFLDNELPPVRMDEVRAAVETDPELAHELEELRQLSVSIRAAAFNPVPVGLESTLAAVGKKRNDLVRLRMGLGIGIAVTACVCAVAMVAVLKGSSSADDVGAVAMNDSALSSKSFISGASPMAEDHADQAKTKMALRAPNKSAGAFRDNPAVMAKSAAASPVTSPHPEAPRAGRTIPEKPAAPAAKVLSTPVASGMDRVSAGHKPFKDSEPTPFAATSKAPAYAISPPPVMLEVASVSDAEAKLRQTIGAHNGSVVSVTSVSAIGEGARQVTVTVPDSEYALTVAAIQDLKKANLTANLAIGGVQTQAPVNQGAGGGGGFGGGGFGGPGGPPIHAGIGGQFGGQGGGQQGSQGGGQGGGQAGFDGFQGRRTRQAVGGRTKEQNFGGQGRGGGSQNVPSNSGNQQAKDVDPSNNSANRSINDNPQTTNGRIDATKAESEKRDSQAAQTKSAQKRLAPPDIKNRAFNPSGLAGAAEANKVLAKPTFRSQYKRPAGSRTIVLILRPVAAVPANRPPAGKIGP